MGWNKREREREREKEREVGLFFSSASQLILIWSHPPLPRLSLSVLIYRTTCLLMKTERKESTENCPTLHTQRCVCVCMCLCMCVHSALVWAVCLFETDNHRLFCLLWETVTNPLWGNIFHSQLRPNSNQLKLTLNFRTSSHIQIKLKDVLWNLSLLLVNLVNHS